jgi:hypothetical protein
MKKKKGIGEYNYSIVIRRPFFFFYEFLQVFAALNLFTVKLLLK